ncbi:MAG: hypothetical protein M3P18_15045 [Actinomycetota bacterium]|nr:hypothetical protein [Actinomycetota bacterium]
MARLSPSAAEFNARSVTVAYLRGGEGGVSTWDSDVTARIMSRFTGTSVGTFNEEELGQMGLGR